MKLLIRQNLVRLQSRAPHGARGLKSSNVFYISNDFLGRAPHGARGLKFLTHCLNCVLNMSGSTRSPWIEISNALSKLRSKYSRAPHGARGLKSILLAHFMICAVVGLHTEPVD